MIKAMTATGAGLLSILICAFLWSTNGLFIKLINWNPFVLAGARSFIAFVFMVIVRLAVPSRRKTPLVPSQLWGGALAYGLTVILFVIATKLTTAANAILLQYGAPVWAALFGWVLAREKPRLVNWISLALVMAGLVVFFKDSLFPAASGAAGAAPRGPYALIGDILAVLSGVTFGANGAVMRVQKGDPNDSMLLAYVFSAAVCVPFFFIFPPELTFKNLAGISFMGIIQIGLASLFFAYGIRRLSAVQAMLTATLEPVLNPVWVFFLLGERPAASALLGGALIILAVLVSALPDRKGAAA